MSLNFMLKQDHMLYKRDSKEAVCLIKWIKIPFAPPPGMTISLDGGIRFKIEDIEWSTTSYCFRAYAKPPIWVLTQKELDTYLNHGWKIDSEDDE